MKFELSAEVQVGKPPPSGGKPAARKTDEHVCPIHGGGPVAQPRTTNVLVEGMQPAAIGDTHICGASQDVLTEGIPHIHWTGAGPASAVGHKTAHGGVQSQGASHVVLVPSGGGWGKAAFDWLNQDAKPEDNARLNAIADIEKSISFALKAGIAAAAPEPTATKAATVFLTGQAINIGVPAVKQLFTGKPEEPLLDQGIDKAGSKFGLSAEQTNLAKQFANTIGGFVGSKLQAKASASNIASNQTRNPGFKGGVSGGAPSSSLLPASNGPLRGANGRFVADPNRVPSSLQRPPLRAGTRAAIENAHPKNAAGQFIDNKGNVIKDPTYGHKFGVENRRIIAAGDKAGLNQSELNDFVNSRPDYFQMEEKAANLSHQGEKPGSASIGHITRAIKQHFGR